MVSSLFDRFHLSDARPSLDARSGTNVVGLIPHFYSVIYPSWSTDLIVSMPSRAYISFLRLSSRDVFDFACRCQCPLGLISHFYCWKRRVYRRRRKRVSMPSRAYISFLRYPFKNLGFMRFPEPVFAGIYQNILTTAVFHAC